MSYVSPKIVELFHLKSAKFKTPWLIQLATGVKRRVSSKVENYMLEIVGQRVMINLNMLLLEAYDVLIGMDWLEKHWSVVNCKDNSINYLSEGGVR